MTIGVIAGNFDVIHPGYIKMFKECKKQCENFVVLLHEDPSIERLEKLKPVLSVDERREILLSIRYIDGVINYKTEQDLYKILKMMNPGIRFLGSDYLGKPFTGQDLNIPVYWLNRNHDWSTTKFKTLIAQSVGGTAELEDCNRL